jgi:hypothetical protein
MRKKIRAKGYPAQKLSNTGLKLNINTRGLTDIWPRSPTVWQEIGSVINANACYHEDKSQIAKKNF